MLTTDQFNSICDHASTVDLNKYRQPLLDAMTEFGIDTNQRCVMFLAQVLHESGSLHVVAENLNYSADGLMKTFPKYYPNAAYANKHARQPIKIASRVYANRMGNGDEASQDGYAYRGRGLIQITGKNNYASFGSDVSQDILVNPSYLETPEGAARSAAWFWHVNNLNRFADKGDIIGCSKAVNGGTNGLQERISYYNHGMDVIKAVPTTTQFTSLIPGSKGSQVAEAQKLLGLDADGSYGPATSAAVKSFQQLNGLSVDGIIGPATWTALHKE